MTAVSKVTLNGTTLMDATTATASANEIISPYTAMTADGVMTTGTGSTGESISSSIVQLAYGTKPAGITSANFDDGLVDTGLVLNDLRKYKYICIKIRLDDARPYLGFNLGNTTVQVVNKNAIALQFTWMDSAKTVLLPISGAAGNASVGGQPHQMPTGNIFITTGDTIHYAGAKPFQDLPNSKVYVGITHMNGLSETTKDMIWAVYGLGEYI